MEEHVFSRNEKLLLLGSVLLILGCLGATVYFGRSNPTLIEARAITEEKATFVDKTIVTTTKKKPSGATTVVVEQRNVTKTEEKRDEQVIVVKDREPTRFSVGVGLVTDVSHIKEVKDAYINLGVRAFGDVWFEGGYQIKAKEVSLGITYEWR